MAVDTVSISKELKAAELPVLQAEAIAAAIGRSAGDSLENAASKGDIALLKSDVSLVRSELMAMESRIETRIEAVQSKLIMWFVSTQIAFVAIIAAIIKL